MSEDDTIPAKVMAEAAALRDGCQECGLRPGWLVVDPADPDVIDRIAEVVYGVQWRDGEKTEGRRVVARAILAALGEAS